MEKIDVNVFVAEMAATTTILQQVNVLKKHFKTLANELNNTEDAVEDIGEPMTNAEIDEICD